MGKFEEFEIRNSVKLKRTETGTLTQGELAEHVGITRQMINLIEAHKYNPKIKVCLAIANVLETSFENLFWMEERQ